MTEIKRTIVESQNVRPHDGSISKTNDVFSQEQLFA